ncbi:TetR/AcrR family transcriptional regulator [Phenylobacterium sp.]|uniref:TetR/AcrR family transcriptional regulator n=1 Tax=Phenylobacterium sp. TaxID=1871053 RepID=UPI002731127E|nr:TetR/AcrR family transcriptional regulator [Phenylobacterium sp.]MDP1875047.1 TetR/AcrR family transcriptional regulator [Phenylobacterium sp.]MDP3491129.1 TetR/AcrR family transcriptional regulator [Phenylobacterium sp.]
MPVPETKPDPAATLRRGPNAARRLATRIRLLDAAIACLHERGYHRTTTTEVIERAGVSRGSLLHQFPSRTDLMVGVAEHIATLRGEAHLAGASQAPDGPERLGWLVDVLWGQVSSPSGVARLELMLASRSDPELAARLGELNARLEARHKELVWSQLRRMGLSNRAESDALVALYSAALRGLSIDALFPEAQTQVEAAVELLKQLLMDRVRGGPGAID